MGQVYGFEKRVIGIKGAKDDKITCAFFHGDQLYAFLKGEKQSHLLVFNIQMYTDKRTVQSLSESAIVVQLDMSHLSKN